MTAHEFEIAFVIETVEADDPRIDRAMEALPGTTISGALGLTIATTLVDAHSAIEAGLHAAKELAAADLAPLRTYPDLVSRQDIADRVGMSRQAVGNWVRGERHNAKPFPVPVTLVAGGAWLWASVVRWIEETGAAELNESALPTLADHCVLDTMMRQGLSRFNVFTLPVGEPRFTAPEVAVTVHSDDAYVAMGSIDTYTLAA
ncbi:XRE family transcriptional regulator [Nocardia sp. MDA0666]|uniref:helix-turn-helix transcriptional regulator n=1 Tax=Nocardia sp. MDA0666 TaxID=2135448 RepID=UPI000D1299DE|nr:helix-turn-helix transcriptional regulator [Nocardia sp. MDA0666]PSR66842.1 XRE family transcriptional regulator [Nocardia sp. MDA0666]